MSKKKSKKNQNINKTEQLNAVNTQEAVNVEAAENAEKAMAENAMAEEAVTEGAAENTEKAAEAVTDSSEEESEESLESAEETVAKEAAENTEKAEESTDESTDESEEESADVNAEESGMTEKLDSVEADDGISAEKQKDDDTDEEEKEFINSILKGKDIASIKSISAEQVKTLAVSEVKILIPVAVCVAVIVFIISVVSSGGSDGTDSTAFVLDNDSDSVQITEEPLLENAYDDVNELMNTFFEALADGDMDTVAALRDYNDETTLITYEKRSEYIEAYLNVTCYTKPGLEEDSYFVYVAYDVKVNGIDTTAPGLNAFYVYTTEDGSLIIDGSMDEQVDAAFKLVTSQDDVVDLYNRIDVSYNEAVASDEELNIFMTELPSKVKTAVGEALAQAQSAQEEDESGDEQENESAGEESEAQEALTENQTVNQIVRTTTTVNVRKSDSEEADRIGKAAAGTELTRIEERINGWSKVIYEGSEAYIKSDYLEVVSTQAVEEAIGMVKATTNVNVRSRADQNSEKLGLAQAGQSYELLEDAGEWYKIKYNGMTGYVKAEYFEVEG